MQKSNQIKTRNLEKTRAEILEAAFSEIFKNGFQGTSVDNIINKTAHTKGAFYHQFPTKLSLGYALVDEIIKPMIHTRWVEPLRSFENPLHGILFQIKKLIGKASHRELRLGCPLNNLVQEMAPIDPIFKKKLEEAIQNWIEGIDNELKRAKKAGFIAKDIKTQEAAHFIVMTHEGFYGMLKGLDSPNAFPALFDSLKRYFDTLEA